MPPIATLPVTWPAQRSLNMLAERRSVATGPSPSIAITGTARNVISDQAAAPSEPMITSARLPPWRRSANSTPTRAESAAQPAIAPIRERATAIPSPKLASSP